MKTRFCPSPTGLLHIGNVRTALFNALAAVLKHGTFLIRIEDTDQERSEQRFTDLLLEDLTWLGLHWQEGPEVGGENGPYWQSQRQDIYNSYYQQLIDAKLAYPCFCTEAELALARKVALSSGRPPRYSGKCHKLSSEQISEKEASGLKPTLRFHVADNQIVEFVDLGKGVQKFSTNDIGDFIIRRADGTAPFLFCNAIDDALMEVTHAIRGEDHLTNTPRQILIANALGLTAPTYAHLSMILGQDGAPLSKRNGSRSLHELRDEGYLPIAILNYLARLGHYYEINSLMTWQELAQHFSFERLGKAAAKFDNEQLLYWQKTAIAQASTETLWQWLPDAAKAIIPTEKQNLFIEIARANFVFPNEALALAQMFFSQKIEFSAQAKSCLGNAEYFAVAIKAWQESQDIKETFNQIKAQLNINGKALYQPLRVALTGELHGPEMAGIVKLLGNDNVLARLQAAKQVGA